MPSKQRFRPETAWFTDLLLSEQDSEYQVARNLHELRHDKPRSLRISIAISFLAMLLVGIGFGAVVALVHKAQPSTAATRNELAARVQTLQARAEALEKRNRKLRAENGQLDSLVLPDLDGALATAFQAQSQQGGYQVSRGRGLILRLRNLDPRASSDQQVMDSDIQVIVDGLWQAGATAVQVNGIRITPQTAIRSAGAAVLVDFHPIASPYIIKAIGPSDLYISFNRSSAAAWIEDLRSNYPIAVTRTDRVKLRLSAGTMPTVDYAERWQP